MRLSSPYHAITFFLLMLAGLCVLARCADGGHPPPQRGEQATVAGEVSNVLTDSEGRVRSFVVAETLITLPPHVGLNRAASLAGANAVTVKGYKRTAGNGFVNSRGRNVIRPVSITVDRITYTIE